MWITCVNVDGEVVTEVEIGDIEVPPPAVEVNGTEYVYLTEHRVYSELPF